MTNSQASELNLADFQAARENVRQVAIETPVLHSNYLSKVTGAEVFLKAENLQRTGAYKLRGAFNRMSKLTPAERKKGVVAASAGNHAQGVALAAKKLGIKATIFMPVGASLPKFQATQNYGAQVVLEGAVFAETLKAAQAYAAKKGAIFIPPFDHLDVIAGQGTVGLEILDQVPDVSTIVVGLGGGGLGAGVAVAAKLAAKAQGRRVKIRLPMLTRSRPASRFRFRLSQPSPTESLFRSRGRFRLTSSRSTSTKS